MKIATTPTNGEILKEEDPYFYGWRYIQRPYLMEKSNGSANR